MTIEIKARVVDSLLNEIILEKLDGIQNAANGIGPMGRGIAGAIRSMAGAVVQTEAFRVCREVNPQVGDAYSTSAGYLSRLGVKRIIHAVTMKYPGGECTLKDVYKAFNEAIFLAQDEGIKRLGCTALGTGVGGLDSEKVGKVMAEIALDSPISIVFLDRDSKFIESVIKTIKESEDDVD